MDVSSDDVDEFLELQGEDVTVYPAPTQVEDTSSLLYGSIKTSTEGTGVVQKAFITQIKNKEIQESDGKWSSNDCRGVFSVNASIAEGVKVKRNNGKLYVVSMIIEGSHDVHHYEVYLKYLRAV